MEDHIIESMSKGVDERRVLIKGVIFWAYTQSMDKFKGEPEEKAKYKFTLGQLSPAAVAKVKEWGIRPKNGADEDKPERGYYVTITQKSKFEVVFEDGEAVEEELGDGTKVAVAVRYYKHENAVKPTLKAGKVIVTDLVPCQRANASDDEDVDLDEAL